MRLDVRSPPDVCAKLTNQAPEASHALFLGRSQFPEFEEDQEVVGPISRVSAWKTRLGFTHPAVEERLLLVPDQRVGSVLWKL